LKKILIIDDSNSIREELTNLLTFENYQVISAHDGEQGLELAKKELPDFIICDIKMPKLDGISVAIELAKDKSTSDILFIFLSAGATIEDKEKAEEMDIPLIIKPFNPEELLDLIYHCVRKK
jgi:DNA-binding response OmpR family regulator